MRPSKLCMHYNMDQEGFLIAIAYAGGKTQLYGCLSTWHAQLKL
jgi:hypothetical protein